MYPLASLSIQLSFLIPEYCSHFNGCCSPLTSGSYEAFSRKFKEGFLGFLVPHRCRDKEQLFQPFHKKLYWDVGCGNRLCNFVASQIKYAYQTITTSRHRGVKWRNRRCFMSGNNTLQCPFVRALSMKYQNITLLPKLPKMICIFIRHCKFEIKKPCSCKYELLKMTSRSDCRKSPNHEDAQLFMGLISNLSSKHTVSRSAQVHYGKTISAKLS